MVESGFVGGCFNVLFNGFSMVFLFSFFLSGCFQWFCFYLWSNGLKRSHSRIVLKKQCCLFRVCLSICFSVCFGVAFFFLSGFLSLFILRFLSGMCFVFGGGVVRERRREAGGGVGGEGGR